MTTTLVKGQNGPLNASTVEITVDLAAAGDLSALLVTDSGKVRTDADFVFFNQPSGPGVTLQTGSGIGTLSIGLLLVVMVSVTAVIGWGPEAYDKVMAAYANPVVHMLELGLVLAVLFHSINGLKITLIDFVPRLVTHIRPIGIGFIAFFVVSAGIVTVTRSLRTSRIRTG